MNEKRFVITETQLKDCINLLVEAPYKYVELPVLILQNLEQLQDKSTPSEANELIEG